jgi:hypothetical protein
MFYIAKQNGVKTFDTSFERRKKKLKNKEKKKK